MNLRLLYMYQAWQSMLVDVTNVLTFLLKLAVCKGTNLNLIWGCFNCVHVHVLRLILLLVY